ncbi:MAG: hypothetical protein H0W27_02075 [Actinobacteria bacterium]|nr:hypothetical protein [Actinomycetota bacterium]
MAGFFSGLYLAKEDPMPMGWDTPRYLGQTTFVAERGLAGVPDELPPPVKTLDSRAAGFPVIALTLSGLFGTNTFTMAVVMPIAAAMAVALATGALFSFSLNRPPWEMGLAALVVGLSPAIIRLMAPETYTDNLFALAVFTAALVPLLSALREERGLAASVLLLAAGGLAHPSFLAIFLMILLLVALAYIPRSWSVWRSHETPLLSTPSARLGMVAAAAAGLTGAALSGLLSATPDAPKLTRGELSKKLREDLPLYVFPLTLPLAALGLGSLAARARGRGGLGTGRNGPERFAAGFLVRLSLAWALVVGIGVLLFALGRLSPAHRFLAFLLPLPVLVGLGLRAAARGLCASGRRRAGAVVFAAGLAGLTALGFWAYYLNIPHQRGIEWLETPKVQEAATAAAYLEEVGVPPNEPVVFVVDDLGANPLSYVPEMAYILRSGLPAERIEHAYFYVGDPDRYLMGEPTYRPRPRTYNTNVDRFWPAVRRLLPQQPVALLLSSFNLAYGEYVGAHPERIAGPNLAVLSGPLPSEPITPPVIPNGPRSWIRGAAILGATAVVLTAIGLAWGLALLPRRLRPFETLGLAPALGIGFLILGGVVMDALGVRLGGAGGAATIAAVAATGAIAAWVRVRRAGRQGLDVEPAVQR